MKFMPLRLSALHCALSLLVCVEIVLSFRGYGQPRARYASEPTKYHAEVLTPHDSSCLVYGINAGGQAVGAAIVPTSGSSYAACAYHDGQIQEYGAGRSSNAISINSNGEAVGEAHSHAVLYSQGRMQDLGTLGGRWSRAKAINERGWVVGESATTLGHSEAFLYQDGKMRSLGSLGGGYSVAYGINNKGQIVGKARDQKGFEYAFLYSNGKMRNLGSLAGGVQPEGGGVLGEAESVANAINDAGQIVGYSLTSVRVEPEPGFSTVFQTHAFLWSNGKMTDIDTADSKLSEAFAINNHGIAVGDLEGRAVLWRSGKAQDLNRLATPDSPTLTMACCINDGGEIVAKGAVTGRNQYFLLSPEPTR